MKESIKENKYEDSGNNSKENLDVKLENNFIQEINNLKFINNKNINNINLSINSNFENKEQIKNKEDKTLQPQNKRVFKIKIPIFFYSIIGCCLLLHWLHFIFSEYVSINNNI